jgi:threonine/homoserine/homoserine lactone efflux protein
MSTSAVAIALTVAAGAVLLSWWGRTMWRNRRTRRGLHRQRSGGS